MKIFLSRFFLMSITVLALASSLKAASPSLGGIGPRGWQRGTEVELTFTGARLTDAKELLFYRKGIETTKMTVVSDTQVKAMVKISPEAGLGEYGIRVRTATGISELRTFYVGALPVIEEKEPNSEFATPQKIAMNVTVHGVANNEDADYFIVDAKKGERISAEVEGMRLGTIVFDPFVAIFNMKRFELSARDDSPLTGQDCFASIVAPEDGQYVILVRESAYGGNGNATYRLHIGNFPRPTGVFPSGGKAGEEIEVTYLGDPTGPMKQKIKLPSVIDPDFKIFPQDAKGICPSGIRFGLSNFPNTFEVEPNDTPEKATLVTFPSSFNGIIEKNADVDCFRFKGVKGQVVDIRCAARKNGSPLDPVMTLAIAGGANVATNDDSGGTDSYFRATLDDKEYILTVTDHLKKGGFDYTYRVDFSPIQGTTLVAIPKVAQYSQDRQTVSVPKGNRFATMMTVQRRDLAGDLKLIAEKLPPGVTISVDAVSTGIDSFAVVFEATKDAPVAGSLSEIKALPADPKLACNTEFNTNAELTFGSPGQSIYWRYNMPTLGVAVTEESPFSIQVIEPKVPLVQNGSMNLKVVVQRKEGFKGPIIVIPVYSPPGVGTIAAITIAENQNEGLFAITANAGARIKNWKTALIASASTPTGVVWASSQLFNLEIAAPFITATIERSAIEQGKTSEILCKITQTTPFEGKAQLQLIGLPLKVTAAPVEIDAKTKEILVKVEIDKTSPVGNHKNIVCSAVITKNGEPIVHTLGNTDIRIDVPAAPKVVATAPVKPGTPAVVAAPVAEKRLSRLEKLRLEQEEREKAQKSAPTPQKK